MFPEHSAESSRPKQPKGHCPRIGKLIRLNRLIKLKGTAPVSRAILTVVTIPEHAKLQLLSSHTEDFDIDGIGSRTDECR